MKIKDKKEFASLVNILNFRYAKAFTNSAPHEYAMGEENTKELEIIRALNRYIQEKHDETEMFWNKEYQVLFVENHKFWSVDKWQITKFLNRNWDFKNNDGTTNVSITESYRGT